MEAEFLIHTGRKMKKINILILLFTVLSISLFAQQTTRVFDDLLVEDLAGGTKLLKFGLDPLATDGIDVIFGESDLPPFPPAGAFEARFFLPQGGFNGTLGSYWDFRQATLPFSGPKEFRLAYQVGTGTVIKFTWNFPGNVNGVLQDIILGTLIVVPMSGTGSYTLANPEAFNRLKMTINYDNTVPVELNSFGATVNGSSVVLNWQTAAEVNNHGFEIQRRSQNSNWDNIGFVEGIGNSTSATSYSFIDENVTGPSYIYRLKQIDFDGVFNYSKEVEVDLTVSDFTLYQNYPNPFNPNTSVRFSVPKEGLVTVKVLNMLGQEIATLLSGNATAGVHTLNWNGKDFNGSDVSSGSYICTMKAGDFTQSIKMILLK